MQPSHDIPADDQQFLDWAFDWAVQRLEDGLTVAPNDVLHGRETLRAEVEELIRLAHDAAITRPAQPIGCLPAVPGYTVLREIGSGGMGTVFLARQDSLGGRAVALKVLPAGFAIAPRARQRFQQEANAIARLRHPNIVAVHDVLHDEATHAYAMEWVDGASLAAVIQAVGEASRREGSRAGHNVALQAVSEAINAPPGAITDPTYEVFIARLGIAMARALAEVHRAGLLHRDIKPSNILLRRDGTPLLSDFGLARETDSTQVTQAGHFVGTVAYASPEQLRGDHTSVNHRSDIYSLGVTLHHALALRPPFDGASTAILLRQIEAGRRVSLRKVNTSILRDLETIIAAAMDADPARRYQSADELADDLERLLSLRPIRARPAGFVTRSIKLVRRNRRSVVAAAIGGVLSLVLALLLVVYVFIVPKWVAAHVQAAHLGMLHPSQGDAMFATAFWNVPISERPHEAFDLNSADNLATIVGRFEDGLRWHPWDRDLRRDRDVADLARRLADASVAGRGATTPSEFHLDQWSWANELPATTAYAVRWSQGQIMPLPGDDEVAATSADDLRSMGLLGFLCGDVDTAVKAWSRLDLLRDPDPLVEAALGQLYIARGEPTRAYPRLRRAVLAFPEADFLVAYLAEAALSAGDLEKAGQLLDRARALDTDDSLRAIDRIHAQWLAATGHDEEALKLFASPSLAMNPVARFHRAMHLGSHGKVQDSLRMLVQLSDEMPRSERIARALIAEADRWWGGLSVEQRAKAMVGTLNPPRGDELVFLDLLRRYQASVELTQRGGGVGAVRGVGERSDNGESPPERRPRIAIRGHRDATDSSNSRISAFSAPLPGEDSSAYLQRASLFDIAHQMEVSDMELWNWIVNYPPLLKAMQAIAWSASQPHNCSLAIQNLAKARHQRVAATVVATSMFVYGSAVGQVDHAFEASLGTLPQVQGWTAFDTGNSPAPTIAGGLLLQGPTVSNCVSGYQYWTRNDIGADYSNNLNVEVRLRVISSNDVYAGVTCNDPGWKAGYYLVVHDVTDHPFYVGFTSDGVFLANDSTANPTDFPRVGGPTTDGLHTYRLQVFENVATLSKDGIALVSLPVGSYVNPDGDDVLFGDGSHLGASQTQLEYVRVSYDTPCTAAPCFQGLGDLPGGAFYSNAVAVSGDGTTVGGSAGVAGGSEAFRWRASTGMVGLGDIAGGPVDSAVEDLSQDGSIAVGAGYGTIPYTACWWTADGILQVIGIPGANSNATGVSPDGSTLAAGYGSPAGYHAAFWTMSTSSWQIIAGSTNPSAVYGMSRNGLWVTGSTNAPSSGAFRYSQSTGWQFLGDLPGGPVSAEGFDISDDGSIVIGRSSTASGVEAMRWTSSSGMVGMGELSGGSFFGTAMSVSADGSIIVGYSNSSLGDEAVMWIQHGTIQRVVEVLAANGVTVPSGWTLRRANDVSVNCEIVTIVGTATNAEGDTEAWIARYSIDNGCIGDINNSDNVNVQDLLAVIGAWGSCTPTPGNCCLADLAPVGSPDGTVNVQDLLAVIGAWGPCGK